MQMLAKAGPSGASIFFLASFTVTVSEISLKVLKLFKLTENQVFLSSHSSVL